MAGRRVVRPVEAAGRLVEDVDPGAVRGEQAGRLVDGQLEDLLRVAQADDPAADLAQRPLRVGPALDVRPGAAQLLDEVGVGHRRGGVVGERPDERDLLVAERVGPAGERAHRAEHPAAAAERGDEERPDREVVDEAVGAGEVDEGRVGRVVAGHDDLVAGDGLAEHPDADVDLQRADPRAALVVGDPGVGREAEDAGRLVEEVGHRAVGPQEAGGLVDRPVEDRGRVRWGGLRGLVAGRRSPGRGRLPARCRRLGGLPPLRAARAVRAIRCRCCRSASSGRPRARRRGRARRRVRRRPPG